VVVDPDRFPLAGRDGPGSILELAFTEVLERAEYDDAATVQLLDAARDQFCLLGVRRSTMEDVARRAGVSRVTVYRRFTNKDRLVELVVRREFRTYFDRFLVDIEHARTVADRVELGFVSALRAFRSNPLIGGLLKAEPELLVPSMVGEGGRTLGTVQRFLAEQLRREQRAGHVSEEVDVGLVAEMMTRVSTSFLVAPDGGVIDLDDEEQLRRVARQFLVPMLDPPRP
jgi:TetR/AcrR family transcriptional repressor of uid operon